MWWNQQQQQLNKAVGIRPNKGCSFWVMYTQLHAQERTQFLAAGKA